MATKTKVLRRWQCAFCLKSQDAEGVEWMVASSVDGIAICGKCVPICIDILAEHQTAKPPAADAVDPHAGTSTDGPRA